MDMKRIIGLLLVAALCLWLAACGKIPEPKPQENQTETMHQESNSSSHSVDGTERPEEAAQQSIELTGPWHLDEQRNDLASFADSLKLFPGYGEWGAGMEIRSDGQMSWYIGAEGWHGTYTVEDGVIHAQLTSDLEQAQRLWDFRIVVENETAELEMDYGDMTIYWIYGAQ